MRSSRLTIIADENMPSVEPLFEEIGKVVRVSGRDLRAEQLVDADLLLVRSVTKVDEALLTQAENLKFVGTATIGMDHLDTAYLDSRKITYSNAAGCNADSVVDYALAAIYREAAIRKVDPKSLSYGVIGAGNVGGRLVARLEKLGVSVLVSDPPKVKRIPSFIDTPLDELLKKSDVVCCHLPLTKAGSDQTYHLLSEAELAHLKPDVIFLNAGRGPTVDGEALKAVALKHPDMTLLLDVWEFEPEVDLELAARTTLATPHIAGYSLEGKLRGTFMLYQRFMEYIGVVAGKQFSSILPLPEKPIMVLEDSTTALEVINFLYNYDDDDTRFRESLSLDASVQRKQFDLLRKTYPVRREFSSLTLTGVVSDSLRHELHALGFNLEVKQ
ncbi:MAG: hypothetical protein RL143_800 [Pseudomonadota bacterium]